MDPEILGMLYGGVCIPVDPARRSRLRRSPAQGQYHVHSGLGRSFTLFQLIRAALFPR
jgi:hypothetical protein